MLTVQERKLCEILGEGYFARSRRGKLIYHRYKPVRNMELGIWMTNGYRTGIFDKYPFSFIKWEGGPYTIEELLAMPVNN